MSQVGTGISRITSLLISDQLRSSVRNTQSEILRAQQAISTGYEVLRPSDSPETTAAIQILRNQLFARDQYNDNLQHVEGLLNFTDVSLSDVNDILLEAKSIAATQANSTSNADTRNNQAAVVDAEIRALMELANRQYQGISIFGGNNGARLGENVFTDFLGGVRYTGAIGSNLQSDLGLAEALDSNSNGLDAFGSLSSRVKSIVDLDPQASNDVRLSDVNGAQGLGIRLGSVQLTVDGTPATVDLNSADTLEDIVVRINNAINAIDPTAGALAIGTSGFNLTASAGHTVSIADISTSETAKDLGIEISATSATVAGGDLDTKLSFHTNLADLGAGIDFASGLLITHGNQTKVADFSTATTVEDLKNVIEQLELGLRLEINADGTSLDLISEVSGIELSIGENGGTTATDLGVRSLGLATELSSFRHGLGVTPEIGENDFAIELHDGQTFEVNIDGLATVGDVLNAISAAATTAGLTVGGVGAGGTDFNVGLATSGNGIVFEDNTAGAGDFRVVQLRSSLAAEHLGIYQNAEAGNTITGSDNSTVRVEGIITNLIDLRDSLSTDDQLGITLAGSRLETDIEGIARVRADVGVRAQRIAQAKERSAEMEITEQEMLSQLREADLTEVITRFTQLQQQLQASLQVGASNLQLSLLDFLR